MGTSKHPSPWFYAGATGGIINTTAVDLVPAIPALTLQNGAANATQRQFCSSIQFANSAAVASEIVVVDKTSSAIVWRGYVPASMTFPVQIEFEPPLQSSPSSTLQVQLLTTATATRVSAQGFTDV